MSATYLRTASSFGISPSRYGAKIASAPITESAASASLRFCAPYTAGDTRGFPPSPRVICKDDDPVAELVLLDQKRTRGELHVAGVRADGENGPRRDRRLRCRERQWRCYDRGDEEQRGGRESRVGHG